MIHFVNPNSPFLIDEGVMPPLGLMYLVAVLKNHGIQATICDLGLGHEIPEGEIYITGTTPQEPEMLKLQRQDYTVVGGPHASICHSELFAKNIFNLVVVGEAEEIIADIVRKKPTGLVYAKRIKNLDQLPFPDRSTAFQYRYEIAGKRATTMITSRGCNGKCAFCCKAIMNKGVFFRSTSNVLAEAEEIKRLGFEAIMFYDDSIAMKRERLLEICRGLEKLGLVWRCFVRSDQVDQELFHEMAGGGCHEVLIGVESGSQKILDTIRKQETVEQNKLAIEMAKKAGIKVKALMIVGLPGESWDTVEESRGFLNATQPDYLDVTVLNVYKGCDIYKNPHKYQLMFSEPLWYKGKHDGYQSTVSTPFMSKDEIVKARSYLWDSFMQLKPA